MEWHSFASKCVLLSVYHLKSDKNYVSCWNQKNCLLQHQKFATFTKLNLLMTKMRCVRTSLYCANKIRAVRY